MLDDAFPHENLNDDALGIPRLHRVPTARDWAECADVMKQHGRTFTFASRFLPVEKRRAAQAAYAYCRIGDDLVDRAVAGESTEEISIALAGWQRQLDIPTHPVAVAFAATRTMYQIPRKPILDLLRGLDMDLAPRPFLTWKDLETYCYCVAGTVGLIVAPILGCKNEQSLTHAVELGIAMQLTNILRDIAEDAELGRLYLPLDDLALFGIDPESILAGMPNGEFKGLMRFEIDRARRLYASARHGISALDLTGQIATVASSQLYASILTSIEQQDHDVFRGRARVSTGRKLQQVPSVLRTVAALRMVPITRSIR